MKKCLYLFVLFLTLYACKEEIDFKDLDGQFAVNFGQLPIRAVDSFDTELGTIVMHSYMVEMSDFKAKMLTYSDYPMRKEDIKDPYMLIDGAKEGALKSLGIDNIQLDQKINIDGHPGVEIKGQNELGFHIHYKLVLRDNRLFQIGFLEEGVDANTTEGLEFIESFVFL